jgi:DNA (cytosine-5)-methyltransferase 1
MGVASGGKTFVSLYSGAGGLDIGFMEAGFVPVFAVDVDSSAAATYSYSYKRLSDRLPHLEGHEHRCDAADLDDCLDGLDSVTAEFVIGGPPCQGFSVAGKMDPSDPRSRHVWRFLDAVERIGPEAFVMENVKALAVNRRWAGLLEGLRERASQLGYTTSVLLLNASHYGVPQARERMFLVGLRGDGILAAPLESSREAPPTVRDALQGLPPWGVPGNDSKCKAKVTPARRPVLRKSPFAGMLFNGAGRPMRLDMPAPTLPASMGGNRTPIVDQNNLEGKGDCWVTSYHAHLKAGGEPYLALPDFLRRITVEEAASVQGFPPDMEWRGRQSAVYRQIGNAVPPPLARAVAISVCDALGL